MLSLRKGLLVKKRSSTSSLASNGPPDDSPQHGTARTVMETIRAGLQESANGLSAKGLRKGSDAVSVSVSTVSSSSSEKTVQLADDAISVSTSNTAHSQVTTTTASIQFTRLAEITRVIRGDICRFGDYTETFFKTLDLRSYLEYISDERLIHMPRRGSDWDRVLRAAQCFGLQLWWFGAGVGQFCLGTESASITALGSTQILLEIGPQQAQALLPTFQALYELSLLILHVSQIHDIYHSSREVKETVAQLYCDVVDLVGNISIHYRRQISGLSAGKSVTVDFDAVFGGDLAAIWKRRDVLTSKMWSLKLGYRNSGLSLKSIRHHLKHDRSVQGSFYDQVAESMKRAEDTCEWVKSPLIEFFRGSDKALTITGDSGTGKTVLAGWIKERLQRPLDHTQFSALLYAFPYDSPGQCTPLEFLKGILFQLLEKSVGDVSLYEKLSTAFESYGQHHSQSKLEASLWVALESGLRTLNDRGANLVIIVDGFHEVSGGKTPLEFHKALRACISKFRTIRMITLSKAISHLSDGCSHFTITPQHLSSDIKAYFRQSFSTLASFSKICGEDGDKIVQELTQKAKTSFVWAYVVTRILAKETTAEGFLKTARGLSASLDETLKKLFTGLLLKSEGVQTLLSFMLAADRPLMVAEMAELLRLNVQKRRFGDEVNVPRLIKSICSDIVAIQGGMIRFKSKSIRLYTETLMGKSLPSAKDSHRHLTLALLLYSRLSLQHDCDPSFDLIADKPLDELFHSNALLYYAVRHWQSHFRASSFCGENGALLLSKDFHEFFPTSCRFALLERSSRSYGLSTSRLIELHEFSLKIRETCFGEKHIAVLQSLIILGNLHVSTTEALTGAKCFYRAATLGKTILSSANAVVVTCTTLFLQYTETITVTTRTEIVTCREQMILLIIEIYKERHGRNSELVMKWYKILAQLYVDIKEEHNATVIRKILVDIHIHIYGKKSPEVRDLCEHLGGMDIVLKGETSVTDVNEYAELFFEATDGKEPDDEKRVEILLRLALFYETQEQWYLAEKIYITLWRRFSEICRLKTTVTFHITKINIALEYVRFLKRLGRIEEASSILICLWIEYEHHSCEDQSIVVLIREIGVLFKAFGLLQIAISVFTKVWGWFKGKGTVTDDEAVQTTILITEVVEEITETTVTTKTTTTTVTEVTETVVREIFETHFTRCKKSKVDLVFFNSCLALVNLFIKGEKWADAEVIIKRSLKVTWKAVLTAEVNIKLSEHFVSECILVATRLAVCYHRQHFFEKAEAIYLRIYYACLSSLQITDVRIEEALAVLIRFYEEHHRHERVIEIYVELLAKYRKQLGASHKLTIKIMYALASHCRLLGRVDAYEYYIEIVKVLNTNRKHCHHDAFEAAVILVTYYHERKSWLELQHICAVLWETFIHHHKECVFTEELIHLIYERYVYVLEFHAKVEISVLYELSVKYRETVTVVFGSPSSILVLAMIALAGVCARIEKHQHESVTIYEEVIKRITETKTTTTTITETTVTTVKKRLSRVYVTIITSGGSTTTTTFERAIQLCLEAYAQLIIEFGCWHEKTLLKLKDIVILYQRLGTKDCHAKVERILTVAFLDIIKSGCGSMSLYHAAATLAKISLTAGLVEYGLKIVRYLRHITIFAEDFNIPTDIVLKLEVSPSKAAFIFLVSFERHLMQKAVLTYSELMAATLLEISLYSEYKRVANTECSVEVILECGAKLRSFWVEQKHEHMLVILDKKLFYTFKTKYSAFIKTHDDYTRIFYLALLASLSKDFTKIDFATLVCKSGNAKVAALLEAGEFKAALEVAKCVFYFAHGQHLYNDVRRARYAYNLAEFMAGIDVRRPNDPKLWSEYLKFSALVTAEALAIFKANKIDFVRLKFEDLAGIVRLLGSQQNYTELEALLLKLWQSREVQKQWDTARVLAVGRLMVHAHVATNHLSAAIDLCDTMCYNLRRSRGALDPVTVEMSQMLAALYTADGCPERAMSIHEQVLREIEATLHKDFHSRAPILYYQSNGNKSPTSPPPAIAQQKPEELAKTASWSLELLKRSHLRMGGWTKPEAEFTALHTRLHERLGKAGLNVSTPDTWAKEKEANKEKPDDLIGKYVGLREWEWLLVVDEEGKGHQHGHVNGANGNVNGMGANGVCGGVIDGSLKRRSRWGNEVDHVLVATKEWLL
ncbi:hypothetical protein QBC34DRAFT_317381 [Podospora aff. communis PSN243]|uniref:Nephrocystin 3-like N-terminal domain-containing protein n=1 Tax=Podospora aff. communis PSN243 TaxID=3040156 RepID=A0AAV9H0I7_9PEZI|nr:hypothetical protein QBC34DRAFT_317381 [Podospora aff. communis PSN243]